MKLNHQISWIGLIAILVMGMAISHDNESSFSKPQLKAGDPVPAIKLTAALTVAEQEYLGLAQTTAFTLLDIPAKIMLVEFLNKYCPHCQQQAPILNELFDKIQADSTLRSQVKMVGIGTGNNQRQLEIYKKEKAIPFPLFPDAQYVFHDEIGRPRTPFIVLFKKQDDGPAIVSATFMGLVSSSDTLLAYLQQLAQPDVFVLQQEAKAEAGVWNEKAEIKKLNEQEFGALVKDYLKTTGVKVSSLERLAIAGEDQLYQARVKLNGTKKILFIRKIYRPTVCDVCHDAYFWYSFDSDGLITHFAPIYLTKAYNKEWREKDVQKFTQRILNHSVHEDFEFDPEVDAVTSATMTSGLIFDTINKTKLLFNKLKEQGIIK